MLSVFLATAGSTFAVNIITGGPTVMPRSRLSTSTPSMPGMRMSSRTRSGRDRRKRLSAVGGGLYGVAYGGEVFAKRVKHNLFVIDDQDSLR